jgi:hypothetical protein
MPTLARPIVAPVDHEGANIHETLSSAECQVTCRWDKDTGSSLDSRGVASTTQEILLVITFTKLALGKPKVRGPNGMEMEKRLIEQLISGGILSTTQSSP